MTLTNTPTDDASDPKYLTLSHQLAARIRAGEWQRGRLPTVREIADEYGTSSFTASRALGVLRESYPTQLRHLVKHELAKDLVQLPISQIERHLAGG